jgi:hypothetical protein
MAVQRTGAERLLSVGVCAMAAADQQRRLTVRRLVSATPLPASDMVAVERLLARLVAQAFAAQHPELFGQPDPPAMGSRDDRSGKEVLS